jgi:hypothetical protein
MGIILLAFLVVLTLAGVGFAIHVLWVGCAGRADYLLARIRAAGEATEPPLLPLVSSRST